MPNQPNECPLGISKSELDKTNHNVGLLEGKIEALEKQLEVVYDQVIIGVNHESLVTSVSKLIDNSKADQEELKNLEEKIEEYHNSQVRDLLEIKEAIYNMGIAAMFFKQGGWKILVAFIFSIVAISVVTTKIIKFNFSPTISNNSESIEKLLELVEEIKDAK